MIDTQHDMNEPYDAQHANFQHALDGARRTPAQLNAILLDEIRVLRERGLSDECIHGLLRGFNIDARPDPVSDHRKLALNDQLIRLIWGKAAPLARAD